MFIEILPFLPTFGPLGHREFDRAPSSVLSAVLDTEWVHAGLDARIRVILKQLRSMPGPALQQIAAMMDEDVRNKFIATLNEPDAPPGQPGAPQ